jgi:hypothetical protein
LPDQPVSRGSMGINRRFKRAMRAGRSRGRMDGGGYGGIKMSEVLLDFAEPLVGGMSLPDDREAFVAALKVAGLLWNEVVSPGPGGRRELYARLDDAIGGPRDPGMEKLFNAVIARGRLLYPDLDRIITGVHVSVDDDGNCTVRVISAVVA